MTAPRHDAPLRRPKFRKGCPHGTLSGYNYWKCSCTRCRAAKSDYDRTKRYRHAQREGLASATIQHGLRVTPTAWRCDCGTLNCRTHAQPWMAA